jgi:cytochrome oxidase Cu insertion factor (SCO1/SenC/PrrC family)
VPPADPALYKMDHTSLVYLVDPEGRVRQSFWPHHGPEEVAAAIRRGQRAA